MRPREILIPIYLWISFSVLLHMLFAGGTRVIADRAGVAAPRVVAQAGAGAPNVSEVEFELPPEPPPEPANAITPPPEVRPQTAARQRPPRVPPPPQRTARVEPPRPVPPPLPLPVPAEPVPTVPRAVRPPPMRQFVDQNAPQENNAPHDPHFLAQTNHDVTEETQAAVRNLERDHPDPHVGGAPRSNRDHTPGNSSEQVSADNENREGRSDRMPNEAPREVRLASASQPPHPATAPGDRAPGAGGAPSVAGTAGREGATGDPVPGGAGSMDVASGAQGQNGQSGTGATQSLPGGLAGLRGMGAGRALQSMLPSWTSYAAVIGDARMNAEADEARRRRSAARGSFTEGWADTRAAIENFVPHVRVGNQTALRTAASPFAAYLTSMHRRIHRLYADGFLADLAGAPSSSPLQNESLVTTLEIVLERSGTVHSLGVVSSSGLLPFDVAALNAVRRAAPYGDAPPEIVSADGRVYMRWGFHRDHRQCGTFNAEPFILPTPGGSGPAAPAPSHPTPDEGLPARLGLVPPAAGRGSRG